MAAVFVLAGGVVGFFSAIASLILLDASFLMALAIWSGAGVGFLGLGLALTLLGKPSDQSTSPLGADPHSA